MFIYLQKGSKCEINCAVNFREIITATDTPVLCMVVFVWAHKEEKKKQQKKKQKNVF